MKKQLSSATFAAVTAAVLLLSAPGPTSFTAPAFASGQSDLLTARGKVVNISQKAKSIALTLKDGSFLLLKFNAETALKELDSLKSIKSGEAIAVTYRPVNGENIAISVGKAHVKLPEGTREIKTEALAALLAGEPKPVLIDSRPVTKFDEGHIPGAVSLPYARLKKMGEKGSDLLTAYGDRQLIFYCGGST